jgi:hypothetical protein
MTHREKVAYLLRDLSQRGISKYTTAPPLYRLLWRLGLEVPPPHFASFGSLALLMGGFFGTMFGLSVWLTMWRSMPVDRALALGLAVGLLSGIAFGILMAISYRVRAMGLALPRWEDYPLRR